MATNVKTLPPKQPRLNSNRQIRWVFDRHTLEVRKRLFVRKELYGGWINEQDHYMLGSLDGTFGREAEALSAAVQYCTEQQERFRTSRTKLVARMCLARQQHD